MQRPPVRAAAANHAGLRARYLAALRVVFFATFLAGFFAAVFFVVFFVAFAMCSLRCGVPHYMKMTTGYPAQIRGATRAIHKMHVDPDPSPGIDSTPSASSASSSSPAPPSRAIVFTARTQLEGGGAAPVSLDTGHRPLLTCDENSLLHLPPFARSPPMLTQRLLAVTQSGADWVLWLLIVLSVISVGIMLERAVFFFVRRIADLDPLSRMLLDGEFSAARQAVERHQGMEAEVVRAVVDHAAKGPDAVSEIVTARMERSRLEYERRLAFLGTLGNNAPFIGLFGTVLGIIRAFSDLASNPGAAGAGTVMAGISDALIATAVGLFVALPAVVMFNLYQRWLRRTSQRAAALGHAAVAWLRSSPSAGR